MATSHTSTPLSLLLLWPFLASAQLLPEPQPQPRYEATSLNVPATRASNWTSADTTRQTYLTLSLYADYAQTRSISRIPGLYEHNPILGSAPSDTRIRNYFLSSALVSYGVARSLPAGLPRSGFQYGVIALQVAVILHNRRVGMQFHY